MVDSPTTGSAPRRKSKAAKLIPLQEAPSSPNVYGQTASKQILHKRDLIDAARRLNPAFVRSAPSAFWSVEGTLRTGSAEETSIKQQISIIENGVNYSTRRYNELRATNDGLTKELKQKLDRLDEEKKNFEDLDAMLKAETREGQRIEALQEEIDTVENDIFRKAHYTRQLDHMLSRLKKNQLKFDVHMCGMEEVMQAIKKEGQDVRLLRRSLDIGLSKVISVLEITQTNLSIARREREIAISQRRLEYDNAVTLQEWMYRREQEKEALAMELRGDLTKEEEAFLRSQIVDKLEKTKSLQRANEESNKRFQAMEEAFSQLKQITGVSSLVDMHEKFSSQRGNKGNLLQEVKDAETRLEAVKAGQLRHEQTFQELRSSGSAVQNSTDSAGSSSSSSRTSSPSKLVSYVSPGSPSHDSARRGGGSGQMGSTGVLVQCSTEEPSREGNDQLEATITAAKNDCKVARAAYERLSAVLLSLQQGANGLLLRVQPHLHLGDAGVFDLTQAGDDSQPWSDTLENLSAGEQVLSKMMEVLAGTTDGTVSPTNKWMAAALDEEEEDEMSVESRSVGTIGEAPSYAFNVRIKSKKTLKELDSHSKAEKDDTTGINASFERSLRDKDNVATLNAEEDDDEVSITQSAYGDRINAVSVSLRTGSRPPLGNMTVLANTSTGLLGKSTVGATEASISNDEDRAGLISKPLVPTRLTVKNASTRAQQEAKRKADLAVRSKRLNERMKAGGSQSLGGGLGEDSAIGNLATLRAQKAMAERLSTIGRTNLPDGVMLHDDPMSKTIAFLNQMPSLT